VHVDAPPEHCAHAPEHGRQTLPLVLYVPVGHAATQVPPLRYGRPVLDPLQAVQLCAPADRHAPHELAHGTQPVPSEKVPAGHDGAHVLPSGWTSSSGLHWLQDVAVAHTAQLVPQGRHCEPVR